MVFSGLSGLRHGPTRTGTDRRAGGPEDGERSRAGDGAPGGAEVGAGRLAAWNGRPRNWLRAAAAAPAHPSLYVNGQVGEGWAAAGVNAWHLLQQHLLLRAPTPPVLEVCFANQNTGLGSHFNQEVAMKKTLRFVALAAVMSLTSWLALGDQAQALAQCSFLHGKSCTHASYCGSSGAGFCVCYKGRYDCGCFQEDGLLVCPGDG